MTHYMNVAYADHTKKCGRLGVYSRESLSYVRIALKWHYLDSSFVQVTFIAPLPAKRLSLPFARRCNFKIHSTPIFLPDPFWALTSYTKFYHVLYTLLCRACLSLFLSISLTKCL